ncbi:hypothetical protein RJ640_005666 [Escallonia rubra]|uniref:Calcium permeable stress-gated cation channel 1 n=1 Tax=Escallonia rubra TaxID=112253 RepID=A0AA88S9M1_9ASTE|nr:hypothetical protein RJ640_005666 [Escallonia rubra]
MATIVDIGVAAGIIIISALVFLLAFAVLRIQPYNDRVYFPKWYLMGLRSRPTHSGKTGSRFWTHVGMAYAFTFWTCYVLQKEYATVASMRLQFLASERRRPDQFTVLVQNVPPDPDESVSESVEHFFMVNHHDHYLTHQVVYSANKLAKLVKKKKGKQNWLHYYQLKYSRNQSARPMMKIAEERRNVTNNPKAIMPAAFVSFRTRWGAAVCAQTQQSRDPTKWLTGWASEPRDVYWANLAIPYVSVSVRRLIIAVAFFFLTLFFMIPIAFVQSLANIEGIEEEARFLKVMIKIPFIKSFIQGFLPGIALKIFLIFLPTILMMMSKFEGFLSISALERRSASRYYLFNFVNVFLGSVITGAAFEQLKAFVNQSANEIPKTIGVAIPMKATFFITYIMVDGWAGVAGEILRLKPLIIYHLKNFFLVKTEKDREKAMDPGSLGFDTSEPQIQLYFLIGLVYAAVTPLLLPFILIFFCLAYVIYRHQIINVYNQKYESAAAYWPDVHGRIIGALVISQLLLMGLISTKLAAQSTPFLIALPLFPADADGSEPSLSVVMEAMMKDTLERAREPHLNLIDYLQNAYIHPVFKERDDDDDDEGEEPNEKWEKESVLVSKISGGSSPSLP